MKTTRKTALKNRVKSKVTPREKTFETIIKDLKKQGANISEGAMEDIWFEINEAGEFGGF